jgi:HAD superfamily phosphatase (TIGR01668 family)
MLKRFIPFAHAKNIYEITNDFYINNGFKYVLCDLDNTLDAYNVATPSLEAHELVERLKKDGIILIITSNNHGPRVETYAKELKVNYISMAGKPFRFGINKFLKKMEINKSNVIMIGDQTVTDISCAYGAKIKAVLTDKLVEIDQPTTRFNRFFDIRIRKKLIKKNLLKDWRTLK